MAITPLKHAPKEYGALRGEYIPEAEKLLGQSCRPYIYTLFASKACSATAVELVPAGLTTAFSVQTAGTYGKLAVISASTDDNSTGSACVVSLKVWGVDSNHNYNLVTATMSGTTSASATTNMYELNNCYTNVFGTSDQNAAGSIKVSMTGKTSKAVLTITSADNFGGHCRIWMPKGWRMKILNLRANFITQVTSGMQADIFPQYYDAYANDDFDGSVDKLAFGSQGISVGSSRFPRVYGNDTTVGKVTFYGRATATETIGVAVKVMLWAEPSALLSTQYKYIVGE